MKNKGKDFNQLKRKITGIAFSIPVGTIFTFNDLNSKSGVVCATDVQQDVGRWFAYFVKHTPNIPFEIIGYRGTSLLYRKIRPNPMHHKRTWKGGTED